MIARFHDSETSRLRMLLSNIELGDIKPLQLFYEMKDVAVSEMGGSLLKMLWFSSLAVSMQQILSASTDKLEGLITTADKIAEVSSFTPFVKAIGNIAVGHSKAQHLFCFDRIEKHISYLAVLYKHCKQTILVQIFVKRVISTINVVIHIPDRLYIGIILNFVLKQANM